VNATSTPLEQTVVFVVLLLLAALLVGVIARRAKLPYVVLLLLASLPLHAHGTQSFEPALFFIFLPALVFEAAWQLDLVVLRHVIWQVVFLVVPGVLLTTVAIAALAYRFGGLPFPEALLLGAILSATDPVAVVAIFKRLAVPHELATIVEGESLLNDGIAGILYAVITSVIIASRVPAPLQIAADALYTSVGGAAVGFAIALVLTLVVRLAQDTMLDIVATLVGAYGAYLVADHFGMSGIFASLVVGASLRAFPHFPVDAEAVDAVDQFWGALAFIANGLVFLLLGLRIDVVRIVHEPGLVAATLGGLVASRVVIAYAGLPLLGLRDERRAWTHAIALAGMRGALSLAFALIIPDRVPYRSQIIDAVFAAVTATLVVQGLAIGPVMRRLPL